MPRTTKTLTTAAGVWIGGLLVVFSLSACAAGGGDAEAAVVTLTDAGISQQDAEIFTDPEVGDTWCTNFLVQDWTKESDIAHKSAPSPEGPVRTQRPLASIDGSPALNRPAFQLPQNSISNRFLGKKTLTLH